jgi:serine/threonine protein kinase
MMRELCQGLKELHEIGVAHRDIKMENILIKENTVTDTFTIKYIDFGLSRVLVNGETSTERFGTMAFCSPELLMGMPYSLQTDVWSLGVVYHSMLTGLIPFINPDKNQTCRNIIRGNIPSQHPAFQKVS